MADWGSSLFLQALGWATLNSFWQMALLWCVFLVLKHFIPLTSHKRYLLAVWSIISGFAWFVYTFIAFYNNGTNEGLTIAIPALRSFELLPAVLTAASVTYLGLLFFPAYRVIRNWNFIQRIKKAGLEKAPMRHRLFVQRISAHMGIGKKVQVFISGLVTSPVTVGFFKPLVLLPVAAVNNLSVQQIEAVLLHELAHIRRHDYLINLIVTLVHVILYFNPFVRFFLKRVELERENCCDELVLQFEYDKLGYATALLQLERAAQSRPVVLAMGAAEKNHLLSRIERIVGTHKKPSFNTAHFAGAFLALLFLFMVNSFIITREKATRGSSIEVYSEPVSFFADMDRRATVEKRKDILNAVPVMIAKAPSGQATIATENNAYADVEPLPDAAYASSQFQHVAFTDVPEVTPQMQEQVTSTIEKTKSVLKSQWIQVEQQIAESMSEKEKLAAKREFLQQVEKIDWQRMEQNLNTEYEKIDWSKINCELDQALVAARMDSLNNCYTEALNKLYEVRSVLNKTDQCAVPDISVHELEKTRKEISEKTEQIRRMRLAAARKVVRL